MSSRKKPEAANVPTAPSRPVGRPSTYSDEVAEIICDRMINGESLVQICADPEMPSRASVYRWMDARPDFEAQCARAREGLAEFELHQLKELADNCTEENVNSTKAKLNHHQWRLMKIAPRTFGERIQTALTGADGGAIQIKATTIDARSLSEDMRDALKQALFEAKRLAGDA
jgi:hypothetical protein